MPVIERLAEWVTVIMTATGAAGVFFMMALESACIPLPSEVILPFAGILVAQGTLSFSAALAWALAGQIAGSVVAYYAGRYGGRAFILRYGKYILLRRKELDLAERWFARYGEITAFVTRLLPGIRTFISLPAGIARMPLWRFLLYSLLGALPWTARSAAFLTTRGLSALAWAPRPGLRGPGSRAPRPGGSWRPWGWRSRPWAS